MAAMIDLTIAGRLSGSRAAKARGKPPGGRPDGRRQKPRGAVRTRTLSEARQFLFASLLLADS